MRWVVLGAGAALLLQGCSSGACSGPPRAPDAPTTAASEVTSTARPPGAGEAMRPTVTGTAPPAEPTGPFGVIVGVVSFEGTPPVPVALKRGSDPVCARGEAVDAAVKVKDGRLANVVLRLDGAGLVPTPPPETPAIVDQQGCTYSPRVQAIVAGQKLLIRNSDPTLHNVHSYVGRRTLSNHAQPPRAPPIDQKYDASAEHLRLSCDIHPWMVAHVVISAHRHFAVTGEDGAFRMIDVPVGTYRMEAWHEKLGQQEGRVTVTEGEPARVVLSYAAQ